MKRGVDLALQAGFNVSLLDLGDGELKDPADMIKAKPAMWTKALKEPKSIVQFYFDKTFKKHDSSTAEGKKNIANVLLPLIKNILNKVEQAHWVTSLSSRLKVREEVLWRQMEVTGVTPIYVKTEETGNNVSEKRQDILEETLLSILLRNLKLAKSVKKISQGELSGFTKEVVEKIKKASAKDFKFDNFVKLFTPDMALQLEFVYLKSQQLWGEYSDEELEEQFGKVLDQFSRRLIVSKLTGLEFDIKEAEELKNSKKIKTLLTQFNDVTQQLVKLDQHTA
jgi:DNA primase